MPILSVNFDTVNVVSAGNRDPDSEKSDESISASKMREFASKNDYNNFRQGVMKGTKEKDAMKLFKDLKTDILYLPTFTFLSFFLFLDPLSLE